MKSTQADWILENLLAVHDFKSLAFFTIFFLFFFIFGKAMLNIIRCMWGWIVLAVALFLLYNGPNTHEMLQEIRKKIQQGISFQIKIQ